MPPDTQVLDPLPPAAAPSRRTRRTLLSVGGVVLVGLVVVLTPAAIRVLDDPAGSAPVHGVDTVSITGDRFDPPAIEVPAGTTVTWQFGDAGAAHNVVGDDWQSEVQDSGSFRHSFDAPGSYPYTCTLHLGMDGRVEVVQR